MRHKAERHAGVVNASALLVALALASAPSASAEFQASGLLEIHYINVGQGGCTLIIGPNGTRILYDFGAVSGDRDIVPYLEDHAGLQPTDGLHYTIVSHRDKDHYMGYREVVRAGFDVLVANYDSGSTKTSPTIRSHWLEIAEKETTAGPVRPIPPGLRLSLGSGAEFLVAAANGRVFRGEHVTVSNENDRSVSVLVTFGKFQYILDGDLGSGPEKCTGRDTSQRKVQPLVARALINLGYLSPDHGVDVMHVAHHGSESSTSSEYYTLIRPEVGLISVGLNQGSFLHPRADVVDRILLDIDRSACVTVRPLRALFQTEEGLRGCSPTGCTSFAGSPVGDIKLTTDGSTGFTVEGTRNVHGGRSELLQLTSFPFDEDE